jgi:small-conductance mechanosensitive channel/CRP-like cAMP-binding protein
MAEAFQWLVTEGGLPFHGLGALLAVVLILAMRVLVPAAERGRLRAPVRLLLAHLCFVGLGLVAKSDSGLQHFAHHGALLALLVCLGRASFVLFADTVLAGHLHRPIPKIFRDILEGLVYTAAVLATLRAAGAELDALLTTSALLTAVIGLSLQDTLGNLFAGLSIQAQNPFEVGDWIQYGSDKRMVGHVVEINWRATKVRTLDEVEVVIPNGPLAKEPIFNFTKPQRFSRRSLYVVLPFDAAPKRVHRIVLAALQHIEGVMSSPEPSIVTEEFTDRGVRYWIRYFTSNFAQRETIDGQLRDRIWYALRRAGIPIAVPVHDVELRHENEQAQISAERELDRRRRALRAVDFCAGLADPQLDDLARATRTRLFAPGEIVIREGDRGEELFIVEQGELVVSVASGGGPAVDVARLDSGSFFGEMSAMTGAPRAATVRAASECQLLVLGKPAFQRLLDVSPQTAEIISDALASRQEQLDSASSKSSTPVVPMGRHAERSGQLLGRIREFFSL